MGSGRPPLLTAFTGTCAALAGCFAFCTVRCWIALLTGREVQFLLLRHLSGVAVGFTIARLGVWIACLEPFVCILIPRAVFILTCAFHLILGIYFFTSAPGIFKGFSSLGNFPL